MNASSHRKTILIGIGNDARGDDALGWLFADQFAEGLSIEVAYRYQLQIEDAELISAFDRVVFVDSSVQEMDKGFDFQPCEPAASVHFSTHKIDPATILWLARKVYSSPVAGYVLAIQGRQWGLQQGLSDFAERNLNNAVSFFQHDILPARAAGSEQHIVHPESL